MQRKTHQVNNFSWTKIFRDMFLLKIQQIHGKILVHVQQVKEQHQLLCPIPVLALAFSETCNFRLIKLNFSELWLFFAADSSLSSIPEFTAFHYGIFAGQIPTHTDNWMITWACTFSVQPSLKRLDLVFWSWGGHWFNINISVEKQFWMCPVPLWAGGRNGDLFCSKAVLLHHLLFFLSSITLLASKSNFIMVAHGSSS